MTLSKKLFLLAGCSGLLVLVLITYQGLGSTVDAEAYWYAAQSFRREYTFLTPFGYYTNWPPLFPFLIANFGAYGVQYTAFFLNVLLLYLFGRLALPQNSLWHFLFFIQNLFSVNFLMIHFFLWSEAWFEVFLLALFGGYAKSFVQKRYSKKSFLLMILLSNLLCLQRMAGIFFVIAFAGLIARHSSIKKAGIFLLASFVGIAAWAIRNSFLQTQPDFLENIFVVPFRQSSCDYSKALFNNFFPTYWFSEIVGIVLLIGLMIFLFYLLFQKNQVISSCACLCVCYLGAMLALRMNVTGESERYVVPIQPFLLLIFWYGVQSCKLNRYLKIFLYVFLFLMMAFQWARTAKNVKQWWQNPPNLIAKTTVQCCTTSLSLGRG